MKNEILERLIGTATAIYEEHGSDDLPAVIAEAEVELERMRLPSIADEPITIAQSEIKALGWRSYSPPDGVTGGKFIEYTDPSHWFVVRFWSNGKVEVYGLQSLESEEPSGVKTTEDLLLLLFLISGKNPRTA